MSVRKHQFSPGTWPGGKDRLDQSTSRVIKRKTTELQRSEMMHQFLVYSVLRLGRKKRDTSDPSSPFNFNAVIATRVRVHGHHVRVVCSRIDTSHAPRPTAKCIFHVKLMSVKKKKKKSTNHIFKVIHLSLCFLCVQEFS